LADRLQAGAESGRPQPTLASALFMCELRLRFGGGLLELADNYRGGVTNAHGFPVACLHGEFDPFSQEYQLHFHIVCAGEKLKTLDRLRNKQGYVRTKKIHRPIRISLLKHQPRRLSYIAQSFWPKKARIPIDGGDSYRRERSTGRIREPYQSLYLV
jgi:hypothetical protein